MLAREIKRERDRESKQTNFDGQLSNFKLFCFPCHPDVVQRRHLKVVQNVFFRRYLNANKKILGADFWQQRRKHICTSGHVNWRQKQIGRSVEILYPYNTREDGVIDSTLFIQLILDINLHCLYTTNRSCRLKHFQLNISQCRCYCIWSLAWHQLRLINYSNFTKALFGRRRWTTGLAQLSIMYGIMLCVCCITFFNLS